MDESLYVPFGDGRYRATPLTQGPWAPDRQHGGPVAALLAHVIESAGPGDWITPQLTVDFLRPVPLAEISVDTELVKDGRRVRCVIARLHSGGVEHARARAWRVASGTSTAGQSPAGDGSGGQDAAGQTPAREHSAAPGPLPLESSYGRARFLFGYQRGVEMRFVRGSFRDPGPATAWARLLVPVLPDTDTSPLQRCVALADFGSGISAAVNRASYSYSNLDLSVHLHRLPAGPWICLDSASAVGAEGTGVCRTTLFDERGACGSAAQSLFVARIPPPRATL